MHENRNLDYLTKQMTLEPHVYESDRRILKSLKFGTRNLYGASAVGKVCNYQVIVWLFWRVGFLAFGSDVILGSLLGVVIVLWILGAEWNSWRISRRVSWAGTFPILKDDQSLSGCQIERHRTRRHSYGDARSMKNRKKKKIDAESMKQWADRVQKGSARQVSKVQNKNNTHWSGRESS
jgi:hypothetical protein